MIVLHYNKKILWCHKCRGETQDWSLWGFVYHYKRGCCMPAFIAYCVVDSGV